MCLTSTPPSPGVGSRLTFGLCFVVWEHLQLAAFQLPLRQKGQVRSISLQKKVNDPKNFLWSKNRSDFRWKHGSVSLHHRQVSNFSPWLDDSSFQLLLDTLAKTRRRGDLRSPRACARSAPAPPQNGAVLPWLSKQYFQLLNWAHRPAHFLAYDPVLLSLLPSIHVISSWSSTLSLFGLCKSCLPLKKAIPWAYSGGSGTSCVFTLGVSHCFRCHCSEYFLCLSSVSGPRLQTSEGGARSGGILALSRHLQHDRESGNASGWASDLPRDRGQWPGPKRGSQSGAVTCVRDLEPVVSLKTRLMPSTSSLSHPSEHADFQKVLLPFHEAGRPRPTPGKSLTVVLAATPLPPVKPGVTSETPERRDSFVAGVRCSRSLCSGVAEEAALGRLRTSPEPFSEPHTNGSGGRNRPALL